MKYRVLLLESKASSVSAAACFCLKDSDVCCTKEQSDRDQFSVSTHTMTDTHCPGESRVPGPSRALGLDIYQYTKSCRA